MKVAIFKDPNFLSGLTICSVIQALTEEGKTWYVCTGAIEGANIPERLQINGEIWTIEEFLSDTRNVLQYDWGDFYLFENSIPIGFVYKPYAYRKLIPLVDFLVRSVDDEYVYVFSKNNYDVKISKIVLPLESIRDESLEHYTYPD